jgi:hypothetical protein
MSVLDDDPAHDLTELCDNCGEMFADCTCGPWADECDVCGSALCDGEECVEYEPDGGYDDE